METKQPYLLIALMVFMHININAQYLEQGAIESTANPVVPANWKEHAYDPEDKRQRRFAINPKELDAKRNKFGRSATSLLLAELVPWTVDRYVRHMDYATISFESLRYNIKPGSWTWDGDGFITNQFGHPYHGSLFFNSFRSNGYNFWQSSVAAFTGSLIWEIAAENQAPAPNDLINTTFGGIVMGEMTHRLAEMIIDNKSRGFKRQASEVFAFIVNPMNGFTRIIDGSWGRPGWNTKQRDSSKLYSEIDVGLREFSVNRRQGDFGPYGRVKFLYGTPYQNYKTPFSNIYINIEFGQDNNAFVNNVNIHGSIKGWPTYSKKKLQQLVVLTANYDYFRNQSFFYSAQSVKFNVNTDFKLKNGVGLNTTISGGPIILASVPDPYLYKGRFYDYCAGVGYNGSGNIYLSKHFSAGIGYRGGWLKTINGNSSHFLLHAFTSEFRIILKNGLSLVAEPGYFTSHGIFPAMSDISTTYHFLRLAARYSFDIK